MVSRLETSPLIQSSSLTMLGRKEAVLTAVATLPEMERRVLELRFGLPQGFPPVEHRPWALDRIADELGITCERVRIVEGQALSRLRYLRDLVAA